MAVFFLPYSEIGLIAALVAIFMSINEDVLQAFRERESLRDEVASARENLLTLRAQEVQYQSMVRVSQMVAHDLQRPISFLGGFVSILEKAGSIGEFQATFNKYRKGVHSTVREANQTIEEILQLGAPALPHLEAVALRELLDETIEFFRNNSESASVEFQITCDPLLTVFAGRGQIRRVIENITGNALRVIKSNGVIRFRVRANDNGRAIFEISNNGPQVPVNERETIFLPFLSGSIGGARGLGLAICREIVAKHGGSIRCQLDEGGWTTFVFDLPLFTEEARHLV